MLGVFVNVGAVIAGSLIGIFLKKGIGDNISNAIMKVMGLLMILIGLQSALKTEEMLCLIVCLVVGTIAGELLKIDDGLTKAGDFAKAKLKVLDAGGGNFTEGFVTASLLFCIGSMVIIGSLEAGVNHDNSIFYAKSVMDCVSAVVLAAAFGPGVICSAFFVLIVQGGLTLLASSASAVLTTPVVTEMSAVGGIILLGMAINMLDLNKPGQTIKAANMIPAIILPPLYLAITSML